MTMKALRLVLTILLGFVVTAAILWGFHQITYSVSAREVDAGDQVNSGWQVSIIDGPGEVDAYESSLQLDADGNPHVAYTLDGSDLRYAALQGDIWISSTVEISALVPSLALDQAGTPHLAYTRRGPFIHYATWSGTDWVTETVENNLGAGVWLVLDKQDDPHLAYWNPRPLFGGGGIWYAYRNGAGWQRDYVEEFFTPPANVPAIALDSQEHPHIAYVLGLDDSLRYAVNHGSGWITETVAFSAASVSMALDKSDHPHIAYTQRGPAVRYVYWDGGEWIDESIDDEIVAGPSLALDQYGNPHVAYCDERPLPVGDGLKYAYRTAGGWVIEEILWVECSNPSLALDTFDNPHIVVYDETNQVYKYLRWGSEPVVETIPPGGGGFSSTVDGTAYDFPQDTFTDTVVITHAGVNEGSLPAGAAGLSGIGHAYDLSAVYSETNQAAQPAPGETYTVTIEYGEDELGQVDEATLGLYYWGGENWIQEPSSKVDTVDNTVIATPDHFSIWGVWGEEWWRVYLPIVEIYK